VPGIASTGAFSQRRSRPVGVGEGVGLGVGVGDGVGLGVRVGDGVGVGVGEGVGLGVTVGEAVALGVGLPLACALGDGVGIAVPAGVGVPLGLGDGGALGASKCGVGNTAPRPVQPASAERKARTTKSRLIPPSAPAKASTLFDAVPLAVGSRVC